MKPSKSTSAALAEKAVVVEDFDVAKFLLDYSTQRLLHPFMGREESVSNAARSLGLSVSALLYRVQKLQDWGILRVAREEARAGRAIKFYTATAQRFFVPFGATRSETLEKYLTEAKQHFEQLLTKSIARSLRRNELDCGMWIYRDESGTICTQMATYSEPSIGMEYHAAQMSTTILDFYYPSLMLSQEDAKALRRELNELVEHYANKEGKQPYLLHIGLAPIAPK